MYMSNAHGCRGMSEPCQTSMMELFVKIALYVTFFAMIPDMFNLRVVLHCEKKCPILEFCWAVFILCTS